MCPTWTYQGSELPDLKGWDSWLIEDDHTPLWKYETKMKKMEGKEEISDESVVIGGNGWLISGCRYSRFATLSLDEPSMRPCCLTMMEKKIMKKLLD